MWKYRNVELEAQIIEISHSWKLQLFGVMIFLDQACKNHAWEKLEKIFLKLNGLQKSALRKTETQIRKETEFLIEIDKLFHIAHSDALSLIKIEEDKGFIMDQRVKE